MQSRASFNLPPRPPNTPECDAIRHASSLRITARRCSRNETIVVVISSAALSRLILPPAPYQFNSGVADTLGADIAALPISLLYLRLVIGEMRAPAPAESAA